jgi:hypothetical protein
MEWLTKELVTVYGPLALGWVAAGYLLYQLMNLNKAFTRQVDRNIEALTELTTLFKERLPRRGRDE